MAFLRPGNDFREVERKAFEWHMERQKKIVQISPSHHTNGTVFMAGDVQVAKIIDGKFFIPK